MSLQKNMKAIWRNGKKFLSSNAFRNRFIYTGFYENEPINEDAILFEAYTSNNFNGNVFYIYDAIMKDERLASKKKYISVKKEAREGVKAMLATYGYEEGRDYTFVEKNSRDYLYQLATAKYLFNNATFSECFIKRPEQKFFNTWHGTPLKAMGRKIQSAPHENGNVTRQMVYADWLLNPNPFFFEHMREDYMLDNAYKGDYVMAGYPRNHRFFDEERNKKIREELDLEGKEVFAYMPTWRGSMQAKSIKGAQAAFEYHLYEIDRKLTNDQVLFVNPHNLIKNQIQFSEYKHIRPFPEEYETYDFLAAADTLITDYSSVFFDFAATGRKIILFAYDQQEYFKNRGVYIPYEELPFPKPDNVEKLILEMQNPEYEPYPEFTATYNLWDEQNSAEQIKNEVFFGESELSKIPGTRYDNGLPNVLIFGGELKKNGLTTSLRGLLNAVDTTTHNYWLLGYRNKVRPHAKFLAELPEGINYIMIQGGKDMTMKEALSQAQYYRQKKVTPEILADIDSISRREIKRSLLGLDFETVIHFTGYERAMANMFTQIDGAKKVIYVHNDMRKEAATGHFHEPSVFRAYREYDEIVGVRDTISDELHELLPELDPSRIKTVHNINDIEGIKYKAALPIEFDRSTTSTMEEETFIEKMNDPNLYKFINVARYDYAKGLDMLVKAFEDVHKEHPNAFLAIIGGHGPEYNALVSYVEEHELTECVALIRSLSNPLSAVAKADCFIMSSRYEGLPMAIMEALIIGKPVICTDITGPREFLSQGYGVLVEESVAGLVKGMDDALDGKIHPRHFDAEAFNEKALKEFYSIL